MYQEFILNHEELAENSLNLMDIESERLSLGANSVMQSRKKNLSSLFSIETLQALAEGLLFISAGISKNGKGR